MSKPIRVQIIKDWEYPNLMRQSPGSSGMWGNVQFSLQAEETCDYVVVCNRISQDTWVHCPPGRIWALVQEPPITEFRWLRKGFHQFDRIYSQDRNLKGKKFRLSHPALPWHVDKSYDELVQYRPTEKNRGLSWITSRSKRFRGHRDRLKFLERLQKSGTEFDSYGRGIDPIADKWDGLASYRYSLAVENYSGPHYWSEKLADCFLSWTMPIYFGCTNLDRFFPSESFVSIDIRSSEAIEVIRDVISSDLWKRQQEAIAYSRDLVLNKYQLFPYLTGLIEQDAGLNSGEAQTMHLEGLPWSMPQPLIDRVRGYGGRGKQKLRKFWHKVVG